MSIADNGRGYNLIRNTSEGDCGKAFFKSTWTESDVTYKGLNISALSHISLTIPGQFMILTSIVIFSYPGSLFQKA